MATVYKALKDATDRVAADFQSSGSAERPPACEYFAAVVHQKLFLQLCGADPETMKGGNPDIAARLLDNGRKIAAHYWAGGNADPASSAE
jgi:hypothetical protein